MPLCTVRTHYSLTFLNALGSLILWHCVECYAGNNRGENSDRLLVSLARWVLTVFCSLATSLPLCRYMSVPSVGELLNLFVGESLHSACNSGRGTNGVYFNLSAVSVWCW